MPPIFINTDNTNPKEKLYVAKLAGDKAAELEKKMQETVVKVIEKDPTFTTNKMKDAKGYSIRLVVSKLKTEGGETNCSLSGEILQYPKLTYMKKGPGTAMVSTSMTGSASATGSFAAVDCVEAITESLVKKAIPIMRAHMTSSR
jgi:hypothetical protein